MWYRRMYHFEDVICVKGVWGHFDETIIHSEVMKVLVVFLDLQQWPNFEVTNTSFVIIIDTFKQMRSQTTTTRVVEATTTISEITRSTSDPSLTGATS